jgi:hypothetical protein
MKLFKLQLKMLENLYHMPVFLIINFLVMNLLIKELMRKIFHFQLKTYNLKH